MPLSPGERLSHYEIIGEVGAGGMGAVYRARDTRLGRDVAIKVSAEKFSERFEREARVIASLNHPNICTLYDVGPNYLVMELIEGSSPKGPLPEARVLDYARQIADALDCAHEKGVTHRDLKPANIKITPDGRVKVLDFGLAKQGSGTDLSSSDAEDLPTLSMSLTEAGVIMGTAAYMSPEQARGSRVDKRSDVWAFGVVLYELLTGRRPFQGHSLTDILAAVLKEPPDLAAVPQRFRPLLERCLEKDPRKRLRDIGDAIGLVRAGTEVPVQANSLRHVPWAVAAVLGAVALWGWLGRSAPGEEQARALVRLPVDLETGTPFGYHYGPNAILSPDGSRVVFVARGADGQSRLYVRPLDQAKARELPGTEDAHSPFFSPNGEFVGFFAESKLKRIEVDGGAPMVLAAASNPRGGSWGEDDQIVGSFGASRYLSSVSANSGPVEDFGVPQEGEFSHRWPQVLPGGKGVLFSINKAAAGWDGANIAVATGPKEPAKIVVPGGTFGKYLPSGHLVYVRGGTLFAVAFDLEKLETRGQAVAVLEDVAYSNLNGGAQVDIARNGTLIYTSGAGGLGKTTVQWLEPGGKMQPLLAKPGAYLWPRIAPTGDRLLITAVDGADPHVNIYDFQSDKLTPIGDGLAVMGAIWTPDARNVLFGTAEGILWGRADGANKPQSLTKSTVMNHPWSIPKDGGTLAYIEQVPQGGFRIQTVPLKTEGGQLQAGKSESFQITRTPGAQATSYFPTFSPDGKWMAYDSNESGRFEVYVRAFPGSPSASGIPISDGGGTIPFWLPNGREILYKNLDQRIRVVKYQINGDSFTAGKPSLWSEKPLADTGTFPNYDVGPDGQVAALMAVEEPTGRNRVTFLMNFTDEIERRIGRSGAK